jgi:CheY-like chemotaxis protein
MTPSVPFSARPYFRRRWLRAASLSMTFAGMMGLALAAEKDNKPVPAKNGAGSGIVTQVQCETERGEPSEEEQRHITVLGAQLLHQIARARNAIDAENNDSAEEAIGKAEAALKLIRQMLPKSVVSTTVMDSAGHVLYEDVEDVREDRITVSRSFTGINVVRPIVESKKIMAEAAGTEFEGSAVIEADVVLNLDYLDRRLREAERVLATDLEHADEALARAQDRGASLVVTAMESPLEDAREALQYAHQAAQRKQYRVAAANLRVAREHLLLYRETAPESAKDEIDKLNKEMDTIAQQIAGTTTAEHEKTTGRVRAFVETVESWWRKPKSAKQN